MKTLRIGCEYKVQQSFEDFAALNISLTEFFSEGFD